MDSEKNKSPASQALHEILDNSRNTEKLLNMCLNVLNENNSILKHGKGSTRGTITYEQMLNYLAVHPMWKLTDKQIYYMVERGDDIRYIMALSGYSAEDIQKKHKKHKDSNVYR